MEDRPPLYEMSREPLPPRWRWFCDRTSWFGAGFLVGRNELQVYFLCWVFGVDKN